MVKKVFWEDPYLTELGAIVTSVDYGDITLDQTNFFAASGGQESDRGSINGQPVLDARKDGLEIIYSLAPNHCIRAGDYVQIAIDWERRYRLMRLHFAAELILEFSYRALAGIQKIGAHISQDKARLDFLWEGNITNYLPTLTQEAKRIIEADKVILSAYSDTSTEKRYWEIEGFARVSCGGTHLKRTGEIGRFTLKRNNIGSGKERIEIYLSSAK